MESDNTIFSDPLQLDTTFIKNSMPIAFMPYMPNLVIKAEETISPLYITLSSFQHACYSTAIYPETAKLIYPILGLIGEVGEVAEKARDYLFPEGCPKGWDEKAMFLKKVFSSLDETAKVGLSAGKVSKVVRDKNNELSPETLKALQDKVLALTDDQKHALGMENLDCNWFIATSLGDMNLNFGEYGEKLLEKLQKRKESGKLGGSGDNR